MTAGQWVEALVGFVLPTAVVLWVVWMLWEWFRPAMKQPTGLSAGTIGFVLICVLVVVIVLAWEMFKTWRRPNWQQRWLANELHLMIDDGFRESGVG